MFSMCLCHLAPRLQDQEDSLPHQEPLHLDLPAGLLPKLHLWGNVMADSFLPRCGTHYLGNVAKCLAKTPNAMLTPSMRSCLSISMRPPPRSSALGLASRWWPSVCRWPSSPWWVSSRWPCGPKGSTAVTWRSSVTTPPSAPPSCPSFCRGALLPWPLRQPRPAPCL